MTKKSKNKKTKKTKTAVAVPTPPPIRLVAAPGSRYSQTDVETIIGPELLALSAKFKVDARQITARQVYAELKTKPAHPLWGLLNTDPARAMDEWVLTQIHHMIRSVRIERVDIPEFTPIPLFESLEDTSARGDGGTGRASVVTLDAKDKSGMQARIAFEKVRRIRHAVDALAAFCSPALPSRFVDLSHALRQALFEFDHPAASLHAAAE